MKGGRGGRGSRGKGRGSGKELMMKILTKWKRKETEQRKAMVNVIQVEESQ